MAAECRLATRALTTLAGHCREDQVICGDGLGLRYQQGPLNDGAELPDVPRPVVFQQRLIGLSGEGLFSSTVSLGKLTQKMPG